MRNVLAIILLGASLAGCGTITKLEQVYNVVATKTVDPSYVLATANAFDALEITAASYLKYCKANLATAICSADNRRTVIKNGRIGRQVRTQLEGYIVTSTPAPAAIYNTLVTVVNALNASPAKNGAPS